MKNFEDSNLNPLIIKALKDIGFIIPTPIQQQSIPCLLNSDKDLIALAQTGTGKTAAFGLPLIHKITFNSKIPQVLVLCPTRELCLQITRDFLRYAQYIPKIKIASMYGGVNIENQIKILKNGVHIVIGTPGRIIDLMNRKHLQLEHIHYLVIDEADEMLNMGFKDDLDIIVKQLSNKRQSLLFSATMSQEMNHIANAYLKNPTEIFIGGRNIISDNIEHIYYVTNIQNKYLTLQRIVDINPNIYGIIFCRTRKETKEISDRLIQNGYNADSIYGDLSQAQREFVMNRFREKHLRILVATDIAARGIDISDITHIIHYNLPNENEIYIHRSGRTGRAGNKGISICIINLKEIYRLKEIEKKIGKIFRRLMIPNGQEICEKRLFHLIEKIEKVIVNDYSIKSYLPLINEKLNVFNREELIKRFVSVEFNYFLDYYKGTKDINVLNFPNFLKNKKLENTNKFNKNFIKKRSRFSKLFLNLGAKHDLTKIELIQLINQSTNSKNINIGRIKILSKSSIFEIDTRYESKILKKMNGINYKGNLITIGLKKN